MVVPSFTNATWVHLFCVNEVVLVAETGVPFNVDPSDQDACNTPLFVIYNDGLLLVPEYPKKANQLFPGVPVIISEADGFIQVSIVKLATV